MIKGGNQLSQLPSNEDLAMEGSRIINQSLCAYVRWVSKLKNLGQLYILQVLKLLNE